MAKIYRLVALGPETLRVNGQAVPVEAGERVSLTEEEYQRLQQTAQRTAFFTAAIDDDGESLPTPGIVEEGGFLPPPGPTDTFEQLVYATPEEDARISAASERNDPSEVFDEYAQTGEALLESMLQDNSPPAPTTKAKGKGKRESAPVDSGAGIKVETVDAGAAAAGITPESPAPAATPEA